LTSLFSINLFSHSWIGSGDPCGLSPARTDMIWLSRPSSLFTPFSELHSRDVRSPRKWTKRVPPLGGTEPVE
jgi:hypothetical protein